MFQGILLTKLEKTLVEGIALDAIDASLHESKRNSRIEI